MKRILSICVAAGFAMPAMGQLLYDNGGIDPQPNGCLNYQYSMIEAPGTIYGNNTLVTAFRQADDFTVPTGEVWTLTELVWQIYQTSSLPTDPITHAFIQVWDTMPMTGGTPAYGDMTTNRIISSVFAEVYRVANFEPQGCARAIKNVTIDMSWLPPLPEGTYWIEIGTQGVGASGPWANHKVPRNIATDNSRFFTVSTGVWDQGIDTNYNGGWDYPFKLYGTSAGGCGCVCDYDVSTGTGVCDIFDFLAFGNKFSAADPCACDLDVSTGNNVCDIFDFLAFGNLFSAGC